MDLLIGDLFRNAARAVPGRLAAVHNGASLTFGDVDRRGNQVARALQDLGVKRGDRILTRCETTLDIIPLFVAAAKIGAVFAPANPVLSDAEVAALIDLARPALVIGQGSSSGTISLETLSTRSSSESSEDVSMGLSERDAHVIFFTSGSTGRPKGVVLSHRAGWLRSFSGPLLEPRGAAVCPYPLFHMGGWTIAMQQWAARDAVVFVRPDAAEICEAVERHRATRLNCIPAVWRRILDHVKRPLDPLRFADTGTSATPVELLHGIQRAAPNAWLRVFYGSTETGSVTMLEQPDVDRKPGSCGVPTPGVEIRTDASGELWVRSPLLFDEYFDDPNATATALVDGWFRTNDLAEIDGDGYVSILGRTGDLIRSGGESISPTEVESTLAAMPEVSDIAVIGVPDPTWGEVVCAVIVPTSAAPTLEQIRAYCNGRLASFKQPRRLEIVETIPRTVATNQVQRRLLVEMLS